TLRRHCAAFHKADYRSWCSKNNFKSMLPDDIEARNTAASLATMTQGSLDGHVRAIEPGEQVVPYSSSLFREAAVDWLTATNQPIRALEHSSFKYMIDVASRATKGLIIPNRRATRGEIILRFKRRMTFLKERLNVSILLIFLL
ncbi:hypothetical protein CONPUDRAFT_54487, partial [Coniophora puteana RWD-64-598 SS2]